MNVEALELALKAPLSLVFVAGTILIALVFCSIQLLRFGPAIRRLNKIEVLAQLYHLAETQREMTREFGHAIAASNATRLAAEQVRTELDALREFIVEAQEKMSEYNADNITQARLQEEDQEKTQSGFFRRINPIRPVEKSPDELFADMKAAWERFTEVFRRRLEEANILPQMNRIGKMTYMLSDKRRKKPLPIETANLITALHSQYRRYIALRGIQPKEHDDFVQLVDTAIRELDATPKQGELSLPPDGKGDFPSAPSPTLN
jgi:hypothetical protein